MNLGTFSISLAVKDLQASKAFYEKLGFRVTDGKADQGWLILSHGEATIGLFQGKFEGNILTFNPPDVRAVQKRLRSQGIAFTRQADESTSGPAHAVLADPDGNVILLDQHAR